MHQFKGCHCRLVSPQTGAAQYCLCTGFAEWPHNTFVEQAMLFVF